MLVAVLSVAGKLDLVTGFVKEESDDDATMGDAATGPKIPPRTPALGVTLLLTFSALFA